MLVITTGSRFWFALAGLSIVGAGVYFVTSGYDKYGSLVLVFGAVAAMIPGLAGVALRDGTVPAAAADGAGPPAAIGDTRLPAIWPALAALGVGFVVVGLAVGGALLYVGFGILAVTLVEWMVQSWAERSTADPAVNQALRNRIMYPIEFPALAAIGIALVVIAFSRVLLAVPRTGSTLVAIVVASLILGVATLLSARPRVSSSLVTAVVVLGAVALLAGGIVAGVAGERSFEAHEGGPESAGEAGEGHQDVGHGGDEPAADPGGHGG